MKSETLTLAAVIVGTFMLAIMAAFAVHEVYEYRKPPMGENEAEFWKTMYLQADKDSTYTNCESLDANYVICKKVPHAQR